MRRSPESIHAPVLLNEVLHWLSPCTGILVDATVGMGGHTEGLLRANETRHVIALDKDREALAVAERRLAEYAHRIQFIHGDFRNLSELLPPAARGKACGVLMDLGVSSLQLDEAERGFSFRADGPLDMRMNGDQEVSAANWLADVSEAELARVLFDYGEERFARRIARSICRARENHAIETTAQLASIVRGAVGGRYRRMRIDPATRTFQAIRIHTNDELGALRQGLQKAFQALCVGGLLCVISFHSLEDRMVKRFFKALEADCVCPPGLPDCVCDKVKEAEILTHKPRIASEEEVNGNPRARSAKLRVARRIA